MLTTHAWISLVVTIAIFLLLQMRRGIPVELLFLSGMIAVTITGVIKPSDALAGFSKPAVITIGALFVVAAGLRNTGVLDWVGQKLLGTAENEKTAMKRLALALVTTSAFLLNTALVVMMVPVVLDWCRRRNISPSKLMIPVSYLAILGGVCSLIGTSTTLIVNSELNSIRESRVEVLRAQGLPTASDPYLEQLKPMSLFEIGRAGIPCAIVGTFVLLLLGHRLLPNRTEMIEKLDEARREYLIEMRVLPECRMINQSVEEAGLRQLPGLFLIEIDRRGEVITPVTPSDVIQANDRLVFTGVIDTIVDLEKIPGLVHEADLTYGIHAPQSSRKLCEAVLSRSSPLIGTTVRKANFRRTHDAAVVAVHRNGKRLATKIGDIVLEPGDTLLLQTRNDFVARHRNSTAFYLVSSVEGYSPRYHNKALLAGLLGLTLVIWLVVASLDFVREAFPMLQDHAFPAVAAMSIAFAMTATRCISLADARSALNLQVLLTIVGALALGKALEDSGAASVIANLLVSRVGPHPWLLLIVIYLLGMFFTEMITNNAVAAILLPLAINVAIAAGISPRPFIIAVSLSASLAFLTPIGYQTNLMVMSPGGYQPRDFLRVGIPLSIFVAITAIVAIYFFFPMEL